MVKGRGRKGKGRGKKGKGMRPRKEKKLIGDDRELATIWTRSLKRRHTDLKMFIVEVPREDFMRRLKKTVDDILALPGNYKWF